MLASRFNGPVMFAGAAEESGADLMDGRGDAYCGMLNAAYNMGLRNIRPYIPEQPVGTPVEVSRMVEEFIPVARVLLGLRKLKIIAFGPRPQDFLACNAPIRPLYDLGVEIMENSELDLYEIYRNTEIDSRVERVAESMIAEPGVKHSFPQSIYKMARYEVALTDFMEKNLGAGKYAVFANKCWPAFERFFGFVPCYVNSRLTARGIPVSCEVDIYGALSEFMTVCTTGLASTLLDINNTVPADMYTQAGSAVKGYEPTDLFMGFHCGNTPSVCLANPELSYHKIMHRLMEPGQSPNITCGTMEGRIKSGPITIFRLHSTADAKLQAYVAQGEVLDIDPKSFGSIGVIAVKEMGRFYRHVLLEKQFPHHTAVAFGHAGRSLYTALRMMGVPDIFYNQPSAMLYKTENPF
jgi:L-fucose isomerase-like protein